MSKSTGKVELPNMINGEGIRDVEPQNLLPKKNLLRLIDVRRPDEYTGELGHVEGAKLVTLETDLENFLLKATPEEKSATTVFICRSGGRSTRAASLATQYGFTDVYNLLGGMMYWNQMKLEVKRT
jgi:rhodanese-related sulfurtransferase